MKTALAVTISVLVGNFLNMEYPFFIAMTAIISMDKTMSSSMKMGKNRILGTFIGALIGVLLSYIDRGNALLCGCGMIILIMVCNAFHLQGSITIGGIVMMAIMIHTDKTPIFYGFHRTLDTCIGASISFAVNALIAPYTNIKRLDEMTIRLWDQTDQLILALQQKKTVDSESVKKDMEAIQYELKLYENEYLLNSKKERVEKLQKHYDMAQRLLLELEILETIDTEKDEIVFNYHIQKALDIYNCYVKGFQIQHEE